ncbi:hypothetical protein M8494_36605 [Serratia ureilytica]
MPINEMASTQVQLCYITAIYPGKVSLADQLRKLDKEGFYYVSGFKKSKMCKDSTINAGWTDCLFKAYGTNILLSGAIGTTIDERTTGMLGSGFYVLC